MNTPLLEIKNLYIEYNNKIVVRNVSFSIMKGEILGIVGESGSGKSTIIKSILDILGNDGIIKSGEILFEGRDILNISTKEMQSIRGKEIGIVFQDCKSSFCPVRTIGNQLVESMKAHMNISKKEVLKNGEEILKEININKPKQFLNSYPFELSGGMNQRAGIMMAMALKPKILLADEPTSALDVTVQKNVIKEMMSLRERYGTTILIVSHNMGVISKMADRVAVMKNGELVEINTTKEIYINPRSEYTKKLIYSMPRFKEN